MPGGPRGDFRDCVNVLPCLEILVLLDKSDVRFPIKLTPRDRRICELSGPLSFRAARPSCLSHGAPNPIEPPLDAGLCIGCWRLQCLLCWVPEILKLAKKCGINHKRKKGIREDDIGKC